MNFDNTCFMIPLSHQDSADLMGPESIMTGYLRLEEQNDEAMKRS